MSRIALVARREIVTRIRTKSYVIGLVLSALMVVAAAAVPRMIGDQTYDVGVVGPVPAAVEGVAFRPYPDEAAARAAVLAGEIDAALINDEKVLAHGELNERLGLILQSAHREAKIAAAGITITPLRVESVGEDAEHTGMRTGVAALLVIVLFFLLIYTAMYVAMGVVEEKGSRIVEILLTSLRPWELLGGKIIGLGVLGLINLGVIVVAGLGAAFAMGTELPPGIGGVVAGAIGWFVLGYLFFATLAAATGSLVSRQEELNSVIAPLTMLMSLTYLVAYAAAFQPGGAFARVLSLIPPFSSMVMPVRMTTGDVPIWEIAPSAVLMAAATVGVLLAGARVYERAVIRTGARVKLREVIG